MIKNIKKILQKVSDKWFGFSKKRRTFLTILVCLLFLLIFGPIFARADAIQQLGDAVGRLLTTIVLFFVDILGTIAVLEMKILVYLAQWRSFTKGVFAVEQGWVIVRDLCNMFFILILLVIAFSTILKIESYAYKKWLAKLVIFAVIINFSKTITGLLIDFSQVIMLTFVSSFKDATAGNLAQGLHLHEFLKSNKSGEVTEGSWTLFGASILALILMVIFGIVMLIMIVMLMGRIVTLWVLTILSPIAYLLQASPIGTKYANQWWEEFSKNLISGPVLAFFLWLALFTIQNATKAQLEASNQEKQFSLLKTVNPDGPDVPDDDNNALAGTSVGANNTPGSSSPTGTEIGRASVLLDFVVVIALLIAAIKVAQSLGVIGSQFAGKMMGNINSFAGKAARGAVGLPLKGALSFLKYADRKTLSKWGIGYQSTKMGIEGIKASFAEKKDQDISEIRERAAARTGLSGVWFGGARGKEWGDRYLSGFVASKGIGTAFGDTFHGSGYAKEQAEKLEEAQKEKDRLEGLKNVEDGTVFSEREKDEKIETIDNEKENIKKEREMLIGTANSAQLEDLESKRSDEEKNITTKNDEIKLSKEKIERLKESKKGKTEKEKEEIDKKIQEENDKIINASKDIESSKNIQDKLDEEIYSISFGGQDIKQMQANGDNITKEIRQLIASKQGKTDDEKKVIDESIEQKRLEKEENSDLIEKKLKESEKNTPKITDFNEKIKKLDKEKQAIKTFDIKDSDFEAILKMDYEKEKEDIDKNVNFTPGEKKAFKKDAEEDYNRSLNKFRNSTDDEKKKNIEERLSHRIDSSIDFEKDPEAYKQKMADERERRTNLIEGDTSLSASEKQRRINRLNKNYDIKEEKLRTSVEREKKVKDDENDRVERERANELNKVRNDKNLTRKQIESKEREINGKYDKRVADNIAQMNSTLKKLLNKEVGGFSEEHFVESIEGSIKSKNDEMRKYKENIAKYSTLGLSARSAHRELVDKKAKEIAGLENYSELISAFRSAMATGDKYTAIAATEKLAKDANFNELLKEYGYDSTGIGQTRFYKEIMGPKFKMNEQEYLSAQNDVSYFAEKAGHWDQARTVRVKSDGKFECMVKEIKNDKGEVVGYDDSDHAIECFADIEKIDPQVIARNLNRLAYGGENGTTGKFEMSKLGAMIVKMLGNNSEFLEKHVSRWNVNIIQNLYKERKKLEKIFEKEPKILNKLMEKLKSAGVSSSGKEMSPENILNDIKSIMDQNN